LVGFVLLTISLLLPSHLISEIFEIDELAGLLFFTVLTAFLQTLSLNILSYFRAKGEGLKYMSFSIIGSLSLVILTYLFLVNFQLGILGVLWAQSVTFFLIWIVILLLLISRYGFRFKLNLFNKLFRFGFPLIFVMAGDLIINTSGTYLLGHFNSLEDVAIFSLAYKIAAISIMVLIGPFQMAYEPFVFKNIGNSNLPDQISRIIVYVLFGFMILSCGILFLFRDLVHVLGTKEYGSAYFLIFFLLPGLGAMIFSYVGQSLLHINNKTNITGRIIFTSTIIFIITSYPLIKYFGITGTIINLNLYLIVSSILIFLFGNKEYKIPLDYAKIVILISTTAVLFFAIYKLSFQKDHLFYSVVPMILLSAIAVFYFSKFFSNSEKENLKKYLTSIVSRVI